MISQCPEGTRITLRDNVAIQHQSLFYLRSRAIVNKNSLVEFLTGQGSQDDIEIQEGNP